MIAFPLGRISEPAPMRRAGGSVFLWRVIATIAVVIAAAISIVVAWGAGYPSFPYDEIDQLQMSRLLAGMDMPKVTGGGYYPLWSLLLAPLWWLTSDPFAVYTGAIAIGVVVGLAAIAPLAAIARRFRLSTSQAIAAAAVTVTIPAVAVQSDYALSERMLFFVTSVAVLAAWRLWERPTHARAILFGLALGALYFTHVRVLAVVLAAAVWIVLFAFRNWRVAFTGAIALAAFTIAAHVGGRELNELLLGSFNQGEGLLDTLRASRPGLLLRSALGQAWSQVVGTFGLAAIGFVVIVRSSWLELRRLRAGRATFVLGIVIAAFLLTTIKWASDYHLYTRPWRRIDTWLYGRYFDSIAIILVVIAVAVIVRGIRRATVLWSIGLSLAVIVPSVLWIGREAPLWAYRTPAHIPGVMPWWGLLPTSEVPPGEIPTLFNDGRFWVVASLTALASLVVILALRRFTTVLVLTSAIAVAVASYAADGSSTEFRTVEGAPPSGIHALREALDQTDATVDFDWGCQPDGSRSALAINYYGFWLLPTVLKQINTSRGDVVDADVLVSCDLFDGGSFVATEGRVRIPDVDFHGRTVWVTPGPVADAIESQLGAR